MEPNFVIAKTARISFERRPIHLRTLAELLGDIGIEKKYIRRCGKRVCLGKAVKSSHSSLWKKYDEAKKVWLKRIRAARHDFVENHDLAAELNAIWTTIKKRFSTLGIE